MAKQGRPTEVQLRRTRDLIERFHLSGFSAPRIREELLALRSDPIDLRVEQVKRHIAAIRRDCGTDFDRGIYPARFSHDWWQERFRDVRKTIEREERRRQREQQG